MQGSTMQTSLSFQLENKKRDLFKLAMKGEWKQVVHIYAVESKTHEVKITRSGDTALHVAVSDGQEDIVEQLLEIISREGPVHAEKVLLTKNESGNTPLHIAASMGNVRMCSCIAIVKPSLIGAFNNDRETPFFLTALHGKKEAFLCLHQNCEPGQGSSYCRRMGGKTILHCAIAGDYFYLAFQIIHLYKELVNSMNERGFTPLHVLASKPSAFKSGSNLGLWNSILYHCIFVDDLKVEETSYVRESLIKSFKEEKNPNHPENYQICINFFRLLGNALRIVVYSRDPKKQNKSVQKTLKDRTLLSMERRTVSNAMPLCLDSVSSSYYECKLWKEPTPTSEGQHICPSNYTTCIQFVKLIYKSILIVLGLGKDPNPITTSMYEYEHTGEAPQETQKDDGEETKPYEISNGGDVAAIKSMLEYDVQPLTPPNSADSSRSTNRQSTDNQKNSTNRKGGEPERETSERENKETAILIAAKNGVTKMVEKILELFPVDIHDMNAEKKNIVLLAVENRQPHVYKLLLKRNILRDSVFWKLDKDGNSALHLAATLGDYKPWLIPGAALQMQWEIKWYEFVKNSMPPHYFVRYNNQRKTPKEIFTEIHKDLVKAGGEWLTNTSESCSVVAALIATVAFATSTAVPGCTNKNNGKPTLEHQPAFEVFAIASLVALCFSVMAVVMFLAILTSRYQEMDFASDLPRKLLVGFTSLFVSIASMLVSFCAGHFFVLEDELKYAAFPVYAVTCLPVSFFAVAQFLLYFDLLWATYKKVPSAVTK
ncbi:hypothetical protein FEM48_ZijujUnG0123300 [Ziziphus jujuba var. spinosa]|uniref:PGG domain-containing protein n=1 Tax=Ziziphus jujuba var. spinosa TaxID=714518 RepID=A0A978U7S6_ZIZJJ|nr:hypothetical protein FEM48_ZijujUnG0123300 [Ziziphus jujuba var. spinosa]